MNKSVKGYRVEKEVKEFYEQRGFFVYRPPRTRFGKQDIMGFGDLLIIPKREVSGRVALVQVKSNRNNFYTARRKARELAPFYPAIDFIVVLREGKGDYREFIVNAEGEEEYYNVLK